jgi:thioredoxin 1
MTNAWKVAVVFVVIAAAVLVVALKSGRGPSSDATVPAPTAGLPRLVDLGSTTCIPCKMMAPILEDLKKAYAGKLQVEFIDVVNVNPAAARRYGIKIIPTQILFDASGKEFFRHEGFLSKEDILAKFRESGIDLAPAGGR